MASWILPNLAGIVFLSLLAPVDWAVIESNKMTNSEEPHIVRLTPRHNVMEHGKDLYFRIPQRYFNFRGPPNGGHIDAITTVLMFPDFRPASRLEMSDPLNNNNIIFVTLINAVSPNNNLVSNMINHTIGGLIKNGRMITIKNDPSHKQYEEIRGNGDKSGQKYSIHDDNGDYFVVICRDRQCRMLALNYKNNNISYRIIFNESHELEYARIKQGVNKFVDGIYIEELGNQ